jgi:two-component system, NtrC family, sensor kinase
VKKRAVTLVLTMSLLDPAFSWAFQSHPAPEGLYVHQMAHTIFVVAMAILTYWLERNRLTLQRGWRLIQISCLLFGVWNATTFIGHWVELRVPDGALLGPAGWNQKLITKGDPLILAYYVLKMDHIICVPAMVCLFLGIRSLYTAACRHEEQTNEKSVCQKFLPIGLALLDEPALAPVDESDIASCICHDSHSIAPIWFTDVIGSALMIVFAFLAIWYAVRLRRLQPSNVLWIYLLWLCLALAGFALSRGVGHIAKRLLLLGNMEPIWSSLKPFSGGINSMAFVIVAAITLFFQRIYRIHTAILDDKKALESATERIVSFNRNLESLVKYRTEELSRSEHKYRRIFEGSMDMIFLLDHQGVFVDINRAGMTTLGYDRATLIGKLKLADLVPCRKELGNLVDEIRTNGFVKDRECKFRNSRGEELHLLLSATARRDESGQVASYEGIGKDITSRVHMERQLQRADRLASLGQISTGIAHEINNPLGIMLGYTQLLLRDHAPDSQTYADLRTIEKHARNCKTVVEDLLKFARSSPTRKSSINVNQCLEDVVSLLAHQLELDGIRLVKNLQGAIPPLIADGEKLKQVFMNLLMNARQAIAGKGTIAIDTYLDDSSNRVNIRISDTGSGIADEVIDKIFDPFFTTKPVGEGTGLGLSVSYGIIQDHNGRIEVQSQPGTGTTFMVCLPTGEDAAQGGRLAAAQIAGTDKDRLKIKTEDTI